MGKVSIAVIGASGYTGEELVKLLLRHPQVELSVITSRQHVGKKLSETFPALNICSELVFSDPNELKGTEAEIFFLALPHGDARGYVERLLSKKKQILDLSSDLRIKDRILFERFYHSEAPSQSLLDQAVYGNPETNCEAIRQAQVVACPGCYPTSVLLALAPALAADLIQLDSIVVHAMSGVSGAGRKAEVPFLFAECNENAKPYGVGTHRHVPEIEQELTRIARKPVQVQFTPHLLPITRGILTSVVAVSKGNLPSLEEMEKVYASYYSGKPFVRFRPGDLPQIKDVVFTNRCDVSLYVDKRTNRLLFFSALDNLTKGAAGQAIQCLNLMKGWDETEGLPR